MLIAGRRRDGSRMDDRELRDQLVTLLLAGHETTATGLAWLFERVLRTPDGQDVTCVQVAGLVARRILNYMEAGAALQRGERYGFIRFGSRVDVYLPLDAQVKVVIGEKVSASATLLAELA